MLNQEERAEKFFDAISRDAHDRNEELTRQNKEMLDLGLKKAEEEAAKQAEAAAKAEAERKATENTRLLEKIVELLEKEIKEEKA